MYELDDTLIAKAETDEDHKSLVTLALGKQRDSNWFYGDVINHNIKLHGDAPAERRRLYGEYAGLLHASRAWVRQLCEIAGSFGNEYRYPNKAWILFRACVNASKRTGRTAQEILEEADTNEWHAPQVNALGQPKKRTLSLVKTCDACGSKVSIRIGGAAATSFRGMVIPCGVCIAIAWQDQRDAKEAEKLGALA